MAESTEETKKRSNAIVETKGSGAHWQKVAAHQATRYDVLPNAIQCTKVPSGTRLNIEALKNNEILSQIVTEIIEKDGESKEEKEDPALSKEYRRFIYEQALNDADESENEEDLLTLEGIPTAFSSLKPPRTSPSKSATIRAITVHFLGPFFGNQSVWIHLFAGS